MHDSRPGSEDVYQGPAQFPWLLLPDATEFFEGQIGIRPFQAHDTAALFDAVRESIDELCEWMVWCHPDYSLRDCSTFVSSCREDWKTGRSYSFVIRDHRDGSLLGSVGLTGINAVHRFANVGYWVRAGRAGAGIGSAAVRLVTRFAFEELGLQRLEMVVPVRNRASRKVAEKAGAKVEGVKRQGIMLGGKSHDAVVYSVVNTEG